MSDSVEDPPAATGGWRAEVAFLRRALIVAALGTLLLALWMAREALLLSFAAVVVAVVLLAAAEPFERRFGLRRRWALASAGGLILAAILLVGLLIGSQVRTQVARLGEVLPQAIQEVEQRFGLQFPGGGPEPRSRGGEEEGAAEAPPGDGPQAGGGTVDPNAVGSILRRIGNVGAMVADVLAAVVLAVAGGIFLAADPGLYRRGLVKLLPRSQQGRAEDALLVSGQALRQWLLATLLSMAIVGLLAGLGAWALGLPAPLAIAIFAALAEFVPVLGSILGAVPALLLALTQGADTFLWTLLLFIAIQQLEGAVITPLIQERLVQIPPALVLLSIVAFGAIFGLPGAVLAAPLAVVAFVLVKKLYIRQTLGQQTDVPGEAGPS